MTAARDAIVVGSGPNGLAAAIVCAASGLRTTVYEAEETLGGGVRTAAITIPGFRHDLGSSIYPFGAASPFFRALPIEAYGLEWLHSRYPLAHPLDDGDAVIVERSIEATAAALGADARAYLHTFGSLVRDWQAIAADVLAPLHWPAAPRAFLRFGAVATLPASVLVRRFRTARGRALVAGLAAHSGEALDAPLTSAVALLLGAFAHAVGWPVARGGAQAIADALVACLHRLGGSTVTGHRVTRLAALPPAAITLFDTSPEDLARVAGEALPASFCRRLARWKRTSAVFKVDWALEGPIPWAAAGCREAATVHVGGTFEEVLASEAAPRLGRTSDRPFVIVAQPSVCDPSRAPHGRHAAWGYCHVAPGATADMTEAIERQVERFAPGFRDRILARRAFAPADLERGNANLVRGDITGGAFTITQFLTRPTWRLYRTPRPDLYLCSSSTPPGAGVHGMCGYFAARTALGAIGLDAIADA